ncbi:PadR family transcriptional regulator [Conexibacter sp. JD483]|uniref:PadR family transcriptional regulator n=1 Tax=unclassified Conexibacter TaxID=2627773 RepID=UPI002719AD89|nr:MULTISPECIES: PadR family transcriptional regulator [unclassified Conexibacter]MDO8188422.1 PadR family transcriptional regulator [Conexibacter sp. CPCC 205706]MDO8198209.1 PadR family transcriptional regulator [Conexibacter sp. CPCC 205762]MDR9370655.1 PadR family transcriptional regulator [Conexibacter sp. JD483]
MSVKYAVLGLLVQRRGYGYDLVQRFEEQIGPGWQLNAGAIYVALDKLEQDGLVRPIATEDAIAPTRRRTVRGAPRVVYEPTERGMERFDEWMKEPSALAPLREELHLKLALSRKNDLPRLLELVAEQEQICRRRLEEHADATPLEQLAERNAAWPALAAAMVRDAESEHLRATVAWLGRVGAAMRTQLGAAAPA